MQLEVEAHHRLWYHSIHGESTGWERDTPIKKKKSGPFKWGVQIRFNCLMHEARQKKSRGGHPNSRQNAKDRINRK